MEDCIYNKTGFQFLRKSFFIALERTIIYSESNDKSVTSKMVDIGITIGKCHDDKEKEQRNKEVKKLWECLVNKDYYTATDLVLNDSYSLLREALNCFSSCAYMATAILCRSVIESSVYKLAIAEWIQWDESTQEIRQFRYSPCNKYMQDYGNALEAVRAKYPELLQKSKKIDEIRSNGNFVAHYSSYIDSKIHKEVTKPIKLWMNAQLAYELLVDTVEFLGNAMVNLANTNRDH